MMELLLAAPDPTDHVAYCATEEGKLPAQSTLLYAATAMEDAGGAGGCGGDVIGGLGVPGLGVGHGGGGLPLHAYVDLSSMLKFHTLLSVGLAKASTLGP
jgi:hypothetical protein